MDILGYFIYFICLLFIFVSCETDTSKEYCMLETFSPRCPTGSVIRMRSATYGRMRLGKCLDSDFGFLGCGGDVLNITDRECSGTQQCDIMVPNAQMNAAVRCLQKNLAPYLEADYTCQKFVTPPRGNCVAPQRLDVTLRPTLISSHVTASQGCGLHESPWVLVAKPGQKITVELTDFFWDNSSVPGDICHKTYGHILDLDTDDVITICGAGRLRHSVVYVSRGSRLQLMFDKSVIQTHRFIVTATAKGCPTYETPPHAKLDHHNDTIRVHCVATNISWVVRCVDDRWLGVAGNCTPVTTRVIHTTTVATNVAVGNVKQDSGAPHVSDNHVIVFSLGCITLLFCCAVVIVGIYGIKRYEVKIKKLKSSPMAKQPIYYSLPTAPQATLRPGTEGQTLRQVRALLATNKPPPSQSMQTSNGGTNTMAHAIYTFPMPKEDRPPKVPSRNLNQNGTIKVKAESKLEAVYENASEEKDSDSAVYYVLENPEDIKEAPVDTKPEVCKDTSVKTKTEVSKDISNKKKPGISEQIYENITKMESFA